MSAHKRRLLSLVVWSGLHAWLLPEAAWAQDALGSGNALDRNPGVGTGGRNTAAPPNPFAGRNAVITGEVVGGREFRGRVGYRAPGDFAVRTPSDSQYRFRAGSAWSSSSAWSLGPSTYDQLRFGQGLGEYTISLQRQGQGATPQTVAQMPTPLSFAQTSESRWQYNNMSLSAVSQEQQQRMVEPSVLRTAISPDGVPIAITTSSLRGLTLEPADYLDRLGLSAYDEVRARQEMIEDYHERQAGTQTVPGQGAPARPEVPGEAVKTQESLAPIDQGLRVGTQFQTRFDSAVAAAPSDSTAIDSRVSGSAQDEYTMMLQRIADRYVRSQDERNATMQPGLVEQLNREYVVLRENLTGRKDPSGRTGAPVSSREPGGMAPVSEPQATGQPGVVDPTEPPPGQAAPGQGGATGSTGNPDSRRAPGSTGAAGAPRTNDARSGSRSTESANPLDIAKIMPALAHGEKIEKLTSEQQGRFNELMMAGEQALRDGEYMNAEQRFQRALRFTPGHPLAMAGLANAQLGAELYLASADSLRVLFTDHPEMIDVSWGEGLLPPRERLDAATKSVRGRLEAPTDRASMALVLAYLGRQTADRALMQEGLDALAAAAGNDPLLPLLRAIWLEGAALPSSQPAAEK
jgi:hypothetical protein